MRVALFLTFALLCFGSTALAQDAAPKGPVKATIGLGASAGGHTLDGRPAAFFFTENGVFVVNMHPQWNASANAGLRVALGREGGRLEGYGNLGLVFQGHRWDYATQYTPRGQASIQSYTHIRLLNVGLNAELMARVKLGRSRRWVIGMGGYASLPLMRFSRTYVELRNGNYWRPYWVGMPAGVQFQVARKFALAGHDWEVFAMGKLGINPSFLFPGQHDKEVHIGANYWFGK